MVRVNSEFVGKNNDKKMKEKAQKASALEHKQKINTALTISGIILVSCAVLSLIYSLLTGVITFKNIDFSALLSLLMAFFAIGLSVFFYVKANETSNRFYDNTYHFTKDISEKIGRMDERVGEKLSNLSDNTNVIRDQIYNGSINKDHEVKDLEDEKEKKEEVNEELISELKKALESKKSDESNTKEVMKNLQEKIKELLVSQSKISTLESLISNNGLKASLRDMLGDIFTNKYYGSESQMIDLANQLLQSFSDDGQKLKLNRQGFIDDQSRLTNKGIGYFSNYIPF